VVLTLPRILVHNNPLPAAVDLLSAVLAIAALALLTRGLHLDGLADTADGLGVKGEGDAVVARRLEVMRAPDVGAFGAATLVLTLLVQVAALTICSIRGFGSVSLVTVVVTGRLVVVWCASVPRAARPDGLGAMVARTVPTVAAGAVTLLVLVAVVALGRIDDDGTWRVGLSLAASCAAGLVVGLLVVRRAVARLGGVTGDVVGAGVELATTAALVVAALAA
jgi:adenosylcobinamide-GDP ribazoletransferase